MERGDQQGSEELAVGGSCMWLQSDSVANPAYKGCKLVAEEGTFRFDFDIQVTR